MEVGPYGRAPGYPAGLEDGGGSESRGPLFGVPPVPGDVAAAGDLIAARQGVYARAEAGSGLRVEARPEAHAHAGFQGDGLAGSDDVGTGGPYENAKPECLIRPLRYEETCLFEYESLEEVRSRIGVFIDKLNSKRSH